MISAFIAGLVMLSPAMAASKHIRHVSLHNLPKPVMAPERKGLQRLFERASAGEKSALVEAAKKGLDAPTIKVLKWKWLLSGHRSIQMPDLVSFLSDGGDRWPRAEKLKRRVEELLLKEKDDAPVLRWFGQHDPVSGRGRLRYAEALYRAGKNVQGDVMMRAAWNTGRFTKSEEKRLLKQYKSALKSADHLDRIDWLIWNGRTGEAVRMLYLLPRDYQLLSKARIALRRSQPGVDAAIRRVPQHLQNDPGLVYERVLWRRKRGLHDGARDLLLAAADPDIQQKRWWKERRLQARKMLTVKKYGSAYQLARSHGLDRGVSFAEGEFMAGWIALRFQQASNTARNHFINLEKGVNYPVSKSRAHYWTGRANEKLNHGQEAVVEYGRAAQHDLTYYGQLALAKTGGVLNLDTDALALIDPGTRQTFMQQGRAQAALVLGKLGDTRNLRSMLYVLQNDTDTNIGQRLVVELAGLSGGPSMAVAIAKRAYHRGVTLPDHAYPVIHQAPGSRVTPALQLALTRQESQFDANAISRVGARGLMQLMPATAKQVARREKLPYSKSRLLTDPNYNITLGTAYLQRLIRQYNGSWALALAAYNAGEGRVKRWRKQHGDPLKGEISMIDWIELIPFTETRNYVQRILESTQIYRIRLGENQGMHIARNSINQPLAAIEEDLLRGSVQNLGLVH